MYSQHKEDTSNATWDTSNGTLFTPLLIVGITVLILVVGTNIIVVLFYSHEALLLINGDAVGHLLCIGMNQVAPVLLDVVGDVDSLCHDASVEAIYPASVVGEDVLHVVHAIFVQVG